MHMGTLTWYPNMYIVLVGPSGCRKGTAMNFSLDILDEIGIKLASEAITREALIRELKTSSASHVDPLTGRMFHHASLTIFSPELTVFLGYQNSQLMSDMTDWFDCRNRWTYRTKNQGTDEIIGVWVNLLGGTTPGLVRETLPNVAISGGLTSRIVFVFGSEKAKKVIIPYGDPEIRAKLVEELIDINMMSGEFKVTESFVAEYGSWYLQSSDLPMTDPRFSGYVDRRATHIAKLSMICCAARSRDMVVDACDFRRAIELLYDVEPRMLEVFEGMGRNPVSEVTFQVSATVKAAGKISYDDLVAAHFHDASTAEIDEIINALSRMGKVTKYYEGKQLFLKRG